MNERNDREGRSGERRAGEGVRIIGAEEAQAALDAGQVAGRRPDDELRFGDVPPAPAGPRSPHRFPLPDSVDPAEAVPRPAVVPPQPAEHGPILRGRPVRAEDAHDSRPWQQRGAARLAPPAHDPAAAAPGSAGAATAAPAIADAATGAPTTADAATADAATAVAATAVAATAANPATDRAAPPDTEAHLALDTTDIARARLDATPDPTTMLPSARWTPSSPGPSPVAPSPAPTDDATWASADRPAVWLPDAGYGRGAGAADPGLYQGPWSERPSSFSAPPTPAPPAWPLAGVASPPAGPAPASPDLAPPEEGITMTGGFGTELPHWSDPPTGDVPRIRPDLGDSEDLAAWEALGAQGTRWRDDATGWDHAGELSDLADDEALVGALDQSRSEHSDLYSFDEDFERLEGERSGAHRVVDDYDDDVAYEEAPVAVGARRRARPPRASRPAPGGPPPGPPGGGHDLGSRAVVGVGLIVLLALAYAVGPVALLLLATAVVVAAAAEVYGLLQHSGFRPATLLGLVATVGIMLAAYWRGAGALGLVVGLVFVVSMMWYLLGIVDARPLANVAVTVTAFVWVGGLGSFAALLLRAHHGRGLFVGAVLPAVAADVVAYFVGRRVGSRLLAPSVSPAKTVEGVVGGAAAAIVVGVIVGRSISPWGGTKHGVLLGLVVAVLAPIGDLFESMIKRDLSVKDSGSVLPGHGGVLDRFDSVLLVLPAAYYLASVFNVVR